MEKINELRTELSNEWKKPKAQNIKEKYDKREARSYKKIEELQAKIEKIKGRIRLQLLNKKSQKSNVRIYLT